MAIAMKEKELKSERAEQAQIVNGLQSMLEGSEQLLGFTRGVIAGGLKGKLSVGVEALFAPAVNVGLTDRRVLLQHIHLETGKPSEILPHTFSLGDVSSVEFTDIETFGKAPAARLLIRRVNDQNFRIRLSGLKAVENAQTITEVFSSIIAQNPALRNSSSQNACSQCKHVLDTLSKFCPYCGFRLMLETVPVNRSKNETASAEERTKDEDSAENSPPDSVHAPEDSTSANEEPGQNKPPIAMETNTVETQEDKTEESQ